MEGLRLARELASGGLSAQHHNGASVSGLHRADLGCAALPAGSVLGVWSFFFDDGHNQTHILKSCLHIFRLSPTEAEGDVLQISRQGMQAGNSVPAECDARPCTQLCDTAGFREYLLCARHQGTQNG